MGLAAEMTYGLRQLIESERTTVTLRKVTVLPGANPAPNPPTYDGLVVDGAFSAGVSVINMRGDPVTGRLIAGDRFTVGTGPTVYAVTGSGSISPATADTLPAVPFTPVLAANAADGAAVVFTVFAADSSFDALVTSPPAILVNGTIVQSDQQIRFLDASLPAGVKPGIGDTLILSSVPAKAIAVKSMEMQGTVYAWSCRVRS
jgi:hypothetical protein